MSSYSLTATTPHTTRSLRALKGQRKLTMLTAYDAPTAKLLAEADIDLLLVGDSVGTVLLGYDSTIPVELEDILHHLKAVRRGLDQLPNKSKIFCVGDLPFMSYQLSDTQALESSGRLLKEGRAHAVKLEGGKEFAPRVKALVTAGIPVMGHIGLMPQSVHAAGGYRTYGKTEREAEQLLEDAMALQDAGAFAVVLECVIPDVAKKITSSLEILTIGIGSGNDVDGQVLVTHDLLGLHAGPVPRFVTPTAHVMNTLKQGLVDFRERTITQQPSIHYPQVNQKKG